MNTYQNAQGFLFNRKFTKQFLSTKKGAADELSTAAPYIISNKSIYI